MKRLILALACISVVATGSAACKRKPNVTAEQQANKSDASTSSHGGEIKLEEEPTSPFAIVANTPAELKIQRIPKGPAIALDPSLRVLYTLERDGSIKALEPFGRMINETQPMMGMGLMLGRVAGVWPENLFVEMAEPGGRSETVISNHSMDIAKGVFKTPLRRKGHVAFASPWKDGSVLAVESDDASVMGPYMYGRPTQFFVTTTGAAGAKKPPPPNNLPENAATLDGEFVSYESGRIFSLAGLKPPKKPGQKDDDYDPTPDTAYIWDFADGVHPKPVKMIGPVDGIVRGRVEGETLVYGPIALKDSQGYVARFDAATSSWTKVETPFVETPSDMSIGDDGSVWAAAEGKVWRADFPALAFKQVFVEGHARSIVARDANDVWVQIGGTLAHSQANKPAKPVDVPDSPDDFAATYENNQPAPAYTAACQVPFFVFGSESEMTEVDARDLAKAKIPETLSGRPVLAKMSDGNVYGYRVEATWMDGPTKAAIAKALGAIKAKRPTSKLVCSRATVVKDLSPDAKQ